MEFNFTFPEGAFDQIHESFYNLCDAEKRLKKARRRARVVRAARRTALIAAVGVLSYNHIKNKKEES